jgi:hypothetical protein
MKKTLLMLALVAGITSFAQNAQAELITINIGSFGIDQPNAGVPNGSTSYISDFPVSATANSFFIYNNYDGNGIRTGLQGDRLTFAAGNDPATPERFGPNATIGSGSSYYSGFRSFKSLFKRGLSISPDFGPGSYMGFQTSQGNYGWLEVTWTASSEEFQILSGAYESVAGTSIVTPAAAPIPEPGTWAAMAIFAGGAAFAGWRRRRQHTL